MTAHDDPGALKILTGGWGFVVPGHDGSPQFEKCADLWAIRAESFLVTDKGIAERVCGGTVLDELKRPAEQWTTHR
jgi:hypothetical protein